MPSTPKNLTKDWDLSPFFGSSKGERSKARILEAAIHVLATEGYGAFTFDAVAKPLNLKRAQIAYHFPVKEELVAMAIRVVYLFGGTVVEKELAKAKVSPLDHMQAYVSGTLNWLLGYRNVSSVVTLALYLATINPVYAEVMREVKNAGVKRVELILSRFFERNPSSSRETHDTAAIVHAYIVGQVIEFMTSPLPKGSIKSYEQTMYQHIAQLLGEV
jgi:AcrR family transcriptional regulator